jgi:hypothetical protein
VCGEGSEVIDKGTAADCRVQSYSYIAGYLNLQKPKNVVGVIPDINLVLKCLFYVETLLLNISSARKMLLVIPIKIVERFQLL